MAQRKGLVYRLTMGKDNLPDFTTDRLPGSRWAVFKDVFFNRIGAMAKISLLTFLFTLPLVVWIIFMTIIRQAEGTMIPYSSNFGIGYPVVTDAVAQGEIRGIFYSVQTYAVAVPLFMLAGLGFAGAFQTMKLLSWGEGVSVAGTFFRGIKQHWLSFILIFAFVGVSVFVLMYGTSVYDAPTYLGKSWRVSIMILSALQFVMMLFLLMYLTTQNVTYKLSVWGLLKNSMLFSVALFPQNLFFLLLSATPIMLILLLPEQISILLWMIFILIGISFIILVWTVYTQWVYDKFVNEHVKGAVKNRGMYVPDAEEKKQAEIERIRTRATKYGAAYASRRMSSIDDGKSFTPLEATFSRADLQRLNEEKSEMRTEIDEEVATINAQLDEEERLYEEEKAAAKKNKRKKNNPQKNNRKKREKIDDTQQIGTLPVTDEEYNED